ncbi:MAG TPA: NADPH-dependent assimilatory sulfite reductase hemoprotein subunit [Alphaproteobacteria bacterium]|nr:NADPH-dependent assimilatory sulfite reductase hemoprotein subunit [Alphaproteobacteria bacterium]
MAEKLSKVETLKQESNFLRGTIKATLEGDAAKFSEDEYNLLKFHGIYQGYDRDSATALKQQGLDKHYELMIRVRMPGGRLTAEQYLQLDDIAEMLGNRTLRVTTRQAIQYHAVVKRNLKALMQGINAALLSTVAACGDVVRNVVTSPAPIKDAKHARLQADAVAISKRFEPQSNAYYEVWLDKEPVTAPESEPVYGPTYLPRKFKIGVGIPEDNSIDILANDLAVVQIWDGETLLGYDFYVGGGFGMTHNKPKTYPRIATPLFFVEPDSMLDAVEAVIKATRDTGDRSDRKHARLKYVVAEKGEAFFKAEVERHFGRALAAPRGHAPFTVPDHAGWHEQGDGRLYLGIVVDSGRIKDEGEFRLRAALRQVVETYRPGVILTPNQDIILADVAPADRGAIEAVLRAAGVTFPEDLLPVERWALACPALPTCGLALTEAERVRGPLVGQVVEAMRRHGVERERVSVRITGCPNGCARPYSGDIGLVGRMPGFYALYVGGDFEGTRLNHRLVDKIPEERIADTLAPLFAAFKAERGAEEGFGNWAHRQGLPRLQALAGVNDAGLLVPAQAAE